MSSDTGGSPNLSSLHTDYRSTHVLIGVPVVASPRRCILSRSRLHRIEQRHQLQPRSLPSLGSASSNQQAVRPCSWHESSNSCRTMTTPGYQIPCFRRFAKPGLTFFNHIALMPRMGYPCQENNNENNCVPQVGSHSSTHYSLPALGSRSPCCHHMA